MTKAGQNVTTTSDCPKCGLSRDDWSDAAQGAARGYLNEGVRYCCQGCLEGPGCTCKQYVAAGRGAPTQEEIRTDRDSGAFVRSLQHQTGHIDDDDYGTDVTRGKPPGPSAGND